MKETDDDEMEYWKRRIPEVRKMGDVRLSERELKRVNAEGSMGT